MSSVSIKDFAYDADHPLHYGITNGYIEDTSERVIQAVALYPFEPENENELKLEQDQVIIINYEYGEGWLVAHDPESGETGLVPSEYVSILDNEPEEIDQPDDNEQHKHQDPQPQKPEEEKAKPFLPGILQELGDLKITQQNTDNQETSAE
ncbi:hypothetical protein KL920_000691 [Ogataea angusta]|nr:hypothetical protein KL920_000691 [Ogataea angusta]